MEAVREAMKWSDNGKTYEGKYENETYEDAVERYITWTAYEAAVKKAEVDKAVGTDGFSVYALRRAPKEIREKTWRLVKEIMKQKKMPKTWSEWVAMLAMKPGESPENLSRRRDLWITAGMQKVVMRCIKTEYERAADERVPGSAAGFTANRNGPEHTLKSRLAREHAMQIDGVVCTAYVDYTQMFKSIVKDCQRETERYCGVHPGVTEIVDVLHSEVRGCYETEYGLTNWFKIMIGTGQGCVNGATRAKLALTLTQKTIHKVCAGYGYAIDEGACITAGTYADDILLQSTSVHEILKMMECCWMISQMSGTKVNIKGKTKTAWMGVYWTTNENGKRIEKDIDCGEWVMRMPDGEKNLLLKHLKVY